jgi:hypothetical protein
VINTVAPNLRNIVKSFIAVNYPRIAAQKENQNVIMMINASLLESAAIPSGVMDSINALLMLTNVASYKKMMTEITIHGNYTKVKDIVAIQTPLITIQRPMEVQDVVT